MGIRSEDDGVERKFSDRENLITKDEEMQKYRLLIHKPK